MKKHPNSIFDWNTINGRSVCVRSTASGQCWKSKRYFRSPAERLISSAVASGGHRVRSKQLEHWCTNDRSRQGVTHHEARSSLRNDHCYVNTRGKCGKVVLVVRPTQFDCRRSKNEIPNSMLCNTYRTRKRGVKVGTERVRYR
ncbi:hypothetical protein EVAR_33226_1 [Eumeta japonica]|uniref:Uncharacterized protein n=1 Tax=Eumeta variegata TaxID=151549 RepID=A0A4C1W233_EUMVA|nr:hypothetical protein EVAR_33226_1 [Eumeta japonica]